jgi:Ca-activated chloride channel family protein
MSPPRLLPVGAAFLALASVEAVQFRSSTEVVSVYATVQDAATRLVPDLKQEDFIVTDNGKEQPITVFSNEVMPFSVVVMLDRSGSMLPHQFVIRDAASVFVRRLLPEDKARIGSFGNYYGNRVVISPSVFSSSQQELIEVLHAPIGVGRDSPIWIAIDQSINELSNREGRRVVLVFSDGYDRPARSLMPVKLKDLVTRARQTSTMIYAIGFADSEPRPNGPPKITPPHEGLRELADDSGGGYFEVVDTANLVDVFTRIAEELHRQYWLGFVPSQRDGKVHEIKVRVKRPGLTVRARQTYIAPSAR